MARQFRPKVPFTQAMKLLIPESVRVQGALKKTYPDPANVSDEQYLFYGSFRTFSGFENVQNGMYTLVDTSKIDTWYRPDIKADCRIYMCETGDVYEVISDPDNINMRHQYLQFKVRKVGGKA